jgi:hypothetical protein
MSKLSFIAATLASIACALALSVGAALAEEHAQPPAAAKALKSAPAGLCFLHDPKPR